MNRPITDAELALVAAAHAYRRAAAAYAVANDGVDGPMLIPSAREKGAARRRLTAAATLLPDEPRAPRKKRVGDVWKNPRGRCYRITGFERPGRAFVEDFATGRRDKGDTDAMVPENGWTLAHEGAGEEEPS